MTIHAKPTLYADTRFRSRLEARWAVYFDAIGLPWVYEPITEHHGYQPDFLIGSTYVEVKPASWNPSDELLQVLYDFRDSGRNLAVYLGEPGRWENGKLVGTALILVIEIGDQIRDSLHAVRDFSYIDAP